MTKLKDLPIKDFKELLAFVVAVVMYYDETLKDGLDLPGDLFGLTDLILPGNNAFDGIEKVPAQFLDMDDEEKAELVDVIKGLELEEDKAEVVAETLSIEVLNIAQSIVKMRNAIKAAQKQSAKLDPAKNPIQIVKAKRA